MLPGLQEAAAERFDKTLDIDKSTESGSAMLAKDGELNGRPCRSRTCDTLIKSQGVSTQAGKEVKSLVLTP